MSQDAIDYFALRPIKVQPVDADGNPIIGDDGRPVIEARAPGDAVPEANGWPNVVNWVNAGRIGIRGVTPFRGPIAPERLKPGKSRGRKRGTRKRVTSADTAESRAPEAPQSPPEPSPEVPVETGEAASAEAPEAASE